MSTNVTLNGVTYAIPAEGDSGWGTVLSNYFIAIASATLQKTGGNFTLTAETNFGANFGISSLYLKSQSANPSSAGVVRLGNNETIGWRNAANNADLTLKVDSGDNLNFNGASLSVGGTPVQNEITVQDTSTIDLDLTSDVLTANIIAGSITNAMISASAAIAYSKISIGAGDIAYSKLTLTGSIVNADISASAAIALSKLAALTASRAVTSDGSGLISASSVTSTELGYVSGVTSAIQTQINAKQDSSSAVTLTGTQALTNKDYDGGTASNSNRLTVPKNTKANLLSLTRKAGTLVYATDESRYYYDDGSTLRVVGSGGWTVTTANTLVDGNNLTISALESQQEFRVQANTSAGATLSTTPFSSTAPPDGARMTVRGLDDTKTVTLVSNNAAKGIMASWTSMTLASGEVANFSYDATLDRYYYLGGSK